MTLGQQQWERSGKLNKLFHQKATLSERLSKFAERDFQKDQCKKKLAAVMA